MTKTKPIVRIRNSRLEDIKEFLKRAISLRKKKKKHMQLKRMYTKTSAH